MSTNQSREPLLYIMQPSIKFPKANMQETFIVTKPGKQKPLLNDEAKEKFDSQTEEQSLVEKNEVNKDEDKKKVEAEKKNPEKMTTKKLDAEEVQEIIEQYHQEQNAKEETTPSKPRTKKSYSFKPVKSFREMNITEKLHYLGNFPRQLPPVPCIFVTQNSSIKGFLLHSAEDIVEVRQFNNKKIELYTSDLIDIKMIGLK